MPPRKPSRPSRGKPDQAAVNRRGRRALVSAARSSPTAATPPAAPARERRRERAVQAAVGFLLGFLGAYAWSLAGLSALPPFRSFHFFPLVGLAGAVLALTRLRPALWGFAGAGTGLVLLVAYTPLVSLLPGDLVRRDPLQPAPAVVVLSSNVNRQGVPDDAFQVRALHAYTLVRQGYAETLVITRLRSKASCLPFVREQVRALGIQAEVVETGPIANTRDEAVRSAALAERRGWKRVLLVSEPTHMRRARAVFRKAGLEVVCAPSPGSGGPREARLPWERLSAMRDWIWESAGYAWYRFRGYL